MSKRRYFKPEEIINKLREAEVLLGKGLTTGQACRKIGISENTFYKWRQMLQSKPPALPDWTSSFSTKLSEFVLAAELH